MTAESKSERQIRPQPLLKWFRSTCEIYPRLNRWPGKLLLPLGIVEWFSEWVYYLFRRWQFIEVIALFVLLAGVANYCWNAPKNWGQRLSPRQRADVMLFGNSLRDLCRTTKYGIIHSRLLVSELNALRRELGDTASDISLTLDSAKVRVQLFNTYLEYAELLITLAESPADSISADMDLLTAKWPNVQEYIQEIDGWFIEQKRKRALAKIASELDSSFQELITQSLDPEDETWWLAVDVCVVALEGASYLKGVNRGKAARAKYVAETFQANYMLINSQIIEATKIMGWAHSDLIRLISDETADTSNLNEFSRRTNDLITSWEILYGSSNEQFVGKSSISY